MVRAMLFICIGCSLDIVEFYKLYSLFIFFSFNGTWSIILLAFCQRNITGQDKDTWRMTIRVKWCNEPPQTKTDLEGNCVFSHTIKHV